MLADNLILLRGLKGLTQEQAAEIAGAVSYTHLTLPTTQTV